MSLFYREPSNSININNTMASIDFSSSFTNYIEKHYCSTYGELVFLCIGTDRSTGDALGPLVGHKLAKPLEKHSNIHVYGTLEDPVHAKNLQSQIDFIYTNFTNPFVIAIDACLGKIDRVGYITIGAGPLNPGAGVNKQLPSVGDLHIMGIVNLGGYMEYMILQNTRLQLVMKMADTIADGIRFSLWKLNKEKLLS
ncbi:putative sporulation protein [Clostridium aceticum]|uniref:Putative sporulation protein n=1 Tax=Clostridium aceticum TaxID=84022 RepID=A0A0D8I7Z5_9CLOT|nr:spore protease YyaC [Clostridium aceticum]AKL97360.1 putative sporulation protein [Clostridium aceticum]KJF26368.1 sporulation protein [Clostridium aceticum]